MFKTDTHRVSRMAARVLMLSLLTVNQAAQSQTIAEVAQKQRAKLQMESNPSTPVAQAAGSVQVINAAQTAKKEVPKSWRLYGVYAVGQMIGADVLAGDQLIRVHKGSTLGPYRVVDVSIAFIKIETDKGCARKCPATKVIQLGEAF